MLGRGDYLTEVVRRHICRHSNCNTGCAIDEQVREGRWEDKWLEQLAIIVATKINGIFIGFIDHRHRSGSKSCLGITHRSWTGIE